MPKIRLDKYLADMLNKTRSQVKTDIKNKKVTVDGSIAKAADLKIDTDTSVIMYDNTRVAYSKYEYYMLNKPSGVVSATTDKNDKTVIDLITTGAKKDLFPVGRLDKDTQGLLLITNDGELAHNLLSPKKHVDKTYFANVTGKVDDAVIKRFKDGIQLEKDFITKPARLGIIESGISDNNGIIYTSITVTIQEGKFHQIKRMFKACGCEVIFLKRLSMGTLTLDESLKPGEYRKLTDKEMSLLGIKSKT